MPFRNKEELFNALGIAIYDDDGQFRKTYDVLNDLAKVWENFSEIEEEYYSKALFKLF